MFRKRNKNISKILILGLDRLSDFLHKVMSHIDLYFNMTYKNAVTDNSQPYLQFTIATMQ